MAESVVSFLITKIGFFMEQETQLLLGVRKEVEFIKGELESMTAFIRSAERVSETDSQVAIWIKQVRDIAFDIEDILDEFQLHLAHEGQVGFMRKTMRFVMTGMYRNQIASEIKDIKARIIDVSERRSRYQSDVLKPGSSRLGAATSNTWQERRGDALLLEEAELVGIDKPKRQLIEWLAGDDPAFKVIGLVGMGGLGKTTLVKKVFDDFSVQNHFKNRVWVTVSESFRIEELLKNIIQQLFKASNLPMPHGLEMMNSRELKHMIKNFLQDSRYLLVLDDVWHVDAWDSIKYAFPRSKHGNRVMLTTRNRRVANAACSEFKGEVYPLEPLSFEMSWELFCRKTFQELECPQHLKCIAQDIVKRCGGLPLAIVAISGVLATKKNSTAYEWEMVKSDLGGESESNKLQSVEKILSLSYYDLPYYLKACLLYICIFPEDYRITRRGLLRLWIAEGFVEAKEGMTVEDVANRYFNELLNRSLIQVASIYGESRIKECCIHDLLREVILSKSNDQSFAVIVNEKNTRWHEKARRLSVQTTWGNAFEKKSISGLRSLLVFGVPDFSITSFVSNLRLVNVLDLRGANIEIFPSEITKLYHLRYLSLRDTKVREIPASIGKLQNLETLNLYGTHVTNLPVTIANLQRLIFLFVWHLQAAPMPLGLDKVCGFDGITEIGCLISLQELEFVDVYRGGEIIKVLRKLTQLRRLGIANLKREDCSMLCTSIEKLVNLRVIYITSVDEEEILDLQHISLPPQFLQELVLRGQLEKVPHWITSLHNLTELSLENSRLREDVFEAIQLLPNLVNLDLVKAFDGSELCFKEGRFQKLKTLRLRELQALSKMVMEEGALPCLENLMFLECAMLEDLPSGIENLAKLKDLQFVEMSKILINKIDRTKGGEDFLRLEHIPRVVCYYYKDGSWHPYFLSKETH